LSSHHMLRFDLEISTLLMYCYSYQHRLTNERIASNGWTLQALMAHARTADPKGSSVAVMLDQEKAYDRVHPEYLKEVLRVFRFPATVIQAISRLFFDTKIHISINGFLSEPVKQGRGLRQGDPLSRSSLIWPLSLCYANSSLKSSL
jgi:hypothetical protein